jgi:serine/threonine protein phosphatase 1
MKRTLVVGDIHGGYKALIEVLENARVAEHDKLIFLGDYVDGWSESPQVIDFLLELDKKYECVFIRGNHDELVLKWLVSDNKDIDEGMWYKHGGKATADAYAMVSVEKRKTHIQFFKNLVDYHLDSENRLFVHAGFSNMHGIDYEYYPRMVYWDRTLWEMVTVLDKNISQQDIRYPSRLKHYKEIYIGHTPTTRLNSTLPLNYANVWNLDTGAGFYGPLTILEVNSKEYWQSQSLPELYPNENGRN